MMPIIHSVGECPATFLVALAIDTTPRSVISPGWTGAFAEVWNMQSFIFGLPGIARSILHQRAIVEKFGETIRSRLLEPPRKAIGVGAQTLHRDALGRSQLRGMTDKPFFEIGTLDLHVKLQRQRGASEAVGLVLHKAGGGEVGGACGQVEGVAMPMQHGRVLE